MQRDILQVCNMFIQAKTMRTLFPNQLTIKHTATVLLLIVSVVIVALFISGTSLDFKSHGSFTVIVDLRKDKRVTIHSYLSSHPWRNISTDVDIKIKLGFDHHGGSVLHDCPGVPGSLQGKISPQSHLHDLNTLEEMYPGMHGRLEPKTCRSRQKLAVIIPYRHREHHLSVMIHNLIPFLKRQYVDFTIFVVNQAPMSKFNRAILLNIGFLEASRIYSFDCFIFHDVDLLPMDDRNLYACGNYPRHMSVAIDKFRFRQIGPEAFGGVVSFTREQFLRINGASNLYFGWGGEDDDLWRRVHGVNMVVIRYPAAVSTYSMIKHDRDTSNDKNPLREKLLETSVQRMFEDGLNTVQYKRLSMNVTNLFMWIDVEVDEKDIWKTAPVLVRHIQKRPRQEGD